MQNTTDLSINSANLQTYWKKADDQSYLHEALTLAQRYTERRSKARIKKSARGVDQRRGENKSYTFNALLSIGSRGLEIQILLGQGIPEMGE